MARCYCDDRAGMMCSSSEEDDIYPAVLSVPVLISLQSSPALGPWLSELQRGASALDPRRIAPSFLSQEPELTDFQESLEQLRLLCHCYSDDSGGMMRSSSEEDNDV